MSSSSNQREQHAMLAALRASRVNRDGHGGALLMRALPFTLVMLAGWTVLFSMLGVPLVAAVVPAAGLTAAMVWVGLHGATVVGEFFGRFLLPSGESTPYEPQFSLEASMAARGDFTGAIESLEGAITGTPLDAPTGITVRLRAAEHYLERAAASKSAEQRTSDHARAVELFREIQRFPGTSPSQDIYVSNRLVDLLLGPLRQPSRALVELGRLVARYPTSSAATHARTAIARLKEELRQDTAENEKYTGY